MTPPGLSLAAGRGSRMKELYGRKAQMPAFRALPASRYYWQLAAMRRAESKKILVVRG